VDRKSIEVDGLRYDYIVETGEIFGEEAAPAEPRPGVEARPITEADLARRGASVAPPPGRFESEKVPLKTLSMSMIGECNLGCTYCYVFEGETPRPAPLRMNVEEGRRQVDFLIDQSGDAKRVTVTFFGGEPLMTFGAVKQIAEYAREKASRAGKDVGFTITTNGTLLSDEAIDFLWAHDVQVTVSLDGPKDVNDLRRPWIGKPAGTYDTIVPRVSRLVERFRDKPYRVGARATLTHGNADVERVVDHLLGLGFHEVATSVATSSDPELKFTDEDYERLGAGLERLATRFADQAIEGRYFGFSNVASLVKRFHEGSVRDYPCGATIGLAGSDPKGNLYVCHRFVGDERYRIGTIDGGLDHEVRNAFIRGNSVRVKDYCRPCWLRHLCGGGCYHEAMVSGSADFSKLEHVCNHLRNFYEHCLRAYVRIAVGNPSFLDRFEPTVLMGSQTTTTSI
jgi:uncharacterized protein